MSSELDDILAEYSAEDVEQTEADNLPTGAEEMELEMYSAEIFAEDVEYERISANIDDLFELDGSDSPTETEHEAEQKEASHQPENGSALLSAIFAALSICAILVLAALVHPDSDVSAVTGGSMRANLSSQMDIYASNLHSAVTGHARDLASRKIYTISETATAGPAPNQANYGTVSADNATSLNTIIDRATSSGLLDGKKLIFRTNTEFYPSSTIQYYYDETILVICWKELVNGKVTSLCESVISDGSQLRRKLSEDTYGSSVYMFCSELSNRANAVAAMNADDYAQRDTGITVYNRVVCRLNEYSYSAKYKAYNATDTLMIDSKGNFVFFKRGMEMTSDEVQQFVDDNDIVFSVAFGPILVEDGQMIASDSYPIGEINSKSSRAGIAQVEDLHYLYMAVSQSNDESSGCTVNEFAQIMSLKGVKNGYCLEGGQTAELYFNGAPYNNIDWGNERTVSDIIYFATALPEGQVSQ